MNKYSEGFLGGLYRTMLKIRVAEERLVEPILNREAFTPCHLYSGEEAVAAGVSVCLETADYVFGNHRSHGHFLAKGGPLGDMIAEILCKENGCSRGRGGSMHLIDPDCGMMGSAPIVAGTISLALGGGMAAQMNSPMYHLPELQGRQRVPGSTPVPSSGATGQAGPAKMSPSGMGPSELHGVNKNRKVSVCFFGDGATNEGVLFECLNFAALKRLPVLFVCENNLYATHMPIRECRPDVPIFEIARPFGIESHQVDGNDVLAVYEIAKEAVAKCRAGEGPVFLECLTYRLRGHVGPDDNIQGDHTDIRPPEEVEEWRKKDPIVRFEKYLIENGVMGREEIEGIKKEVEEQVEEAFAFARGSAFPEPEDLGKYVFKE